MVIMGSIPERDSRTSKLYNTGIAVNPAGELAAKHRKLHLFDINIPGRAVYKESDTFAAGDGVTVYDAGFCKFGLGICYDIRFAEQALVMTQKLGKNDLLRRGGGVIIILDLQAHKFSCTPDRSRWLLDLSTGSCC